MKFLSILNFALWAPLLLLANLTNPSFQAIGHGGSDNIANLPPDLLPDYFALNALCATAGPKAVRCLSYLSSIDPLLKWNRLVRQRPLCWRVQKGRLLQPVWPSFHSRPWAFSNGTGLQLRKLLCPSVSTRFTILSLHIISMPNSESIFLKKLFLFLSGIRTAVGAQYRPSLFRLSRARCTSMSLMSIKLLLGKAPPVSRMGCLKPFSWFWRFKGRCKIPSFSMRYVLKTSFYSRWHLT